MIRFLTLTSALVLSLATYCHAQSIIRSTVGSGGSSQSITSNNKTYFISQSIGQASVIGTSTNNGKSVRQGFQQPPAFIIVPATLAENDFAALVYPNPSSQSIHIEFKEEIDDDIAITMHDVAGKVVFNREYTSAQKLELSIQFLAGGEYIMNIITGNKRFSTALIKQ